METVFKNISSSVTTDTAAKNELELINRYTIKPLEADEVFCFTLTLCDNEIDRDTERFTVPALIKLASMFEGRTGIMDHNMKSDCQTARIFKTWIEESESETTSTGEKYTCLKARAYMPLTPKNEELVKQIEAGIKKETSVSCSVAAMSCSVCGADLRKKGCKHRKGEIYDGKLCHTVLSEPTDAYEWSFVAVPAQPRAGVTKAFEAQDPRIAQAAAALAYYRTVLRDAADSNGTTSFKAGDVTVTRTPVAMLEIAGKIRDEALAQAADLLTDRDFIFRQVGI